MLASSWPSLRVAMSGHWVLGISDGLTGRANSLFFLNSKDDTNVAERLDWAEKTFRQAGLLPRIRLTPLAPVKVIEEIKRRGYVFQNPTMVLKCSLQRASQFHDSAGSKIITFEKLKEDWLSCFVDANPRYQESANRDILVAMLRGMMTEVRYLMLLKDDEPVATSMLTRQLYLANIQNVSTKDGLRRKGFATTIMAASQKSAQEMGAKMSWLAVEQGNQPALNLYKKLGYENFYTYIYASLENKD